jgi:DNA-binding transcriptional regulator YiaG
MSPPSHPNRSRRRIAGPTRGPRNPRPAEIVQLREEMELTQTELGELLYAGLSTVQAWEGGTRRMPALAWEYLCLLQAFPEVAAARKRWLDGGPPWPE